MIVQPEDINFFTLFFITGLEFISIVEEFL